MVLVGLFSSLSGFVAIWFFVFFFVSSARFIRLRLQLFFTFKWWLCFCNNNSNVINFGGYRSVQEENFETKTIGSNIYLFKVHYLSNEGSKLFDCSVFTWFKMPTSTSSTQRRILICVKWIWINWLFASFFVMISW